MRVRVLWGAAVQASSAQWTITPDALAGLNASLLNPARTNVLNMNIIIERCARVGRAPSEKCGSQLFLPLRPFL